MTVVNLAPADSAPDDTNGTPPDGGPVLVEAQALLSHRIARRSAVHWQGRVHEKLVSAAAARGLARPLREARLEGARIVHHGYVDADRRQAKAERNLAIAQARLDELVGLGSPDLQAAASVLLDLGRTYLGLGRQQAAVDSFEALREIAPDGPERAAATVLLAQLLADARGFDDVVLHLVGELRTDGITRPALCDWLEAQVHARVPSRQEHALELMSGITELVDPAGNHRSLGPVLQTRALLAGSLGHIDRAGADLLDAVADHGTGLDQLPLLLQLYASRRTELAVTLARKLLAGAPAAEATAETTES